MPSSTVNDVQKLNKNSKRKSIDDNTNDDSSKRPKCIVIEGLKKAVKEVSNNYIPVSQKERRLFYCRVCDKQHSNLEDYKAHFTADAHQRAQLIERKASFCNSCQKQLTSPQQLEDHLKSKPHYERLENIKNRTTTVRNNYNRGQQNRTNTVPNNIRGRRQQRSW
mmetsp:Transcript_24643/g.28087  ORF Transcript_24643/g.28087 Transcript_24643/m.28087 type:complete len:165 (+) Transcript_24643:111-605(+)